MISLVLALVLQQFGTQDIDKVLERADALLEEAKAGYEAARDKSSAPAFIDAGFKLEEARIKYIVVQEIGASDKQKIASDRLRAVNQLGKLIHDGKVAISGTPAESTPEKPAAPDKPGEPAPAAPPEKALRPAADVSKRAAAPDAAKQKEAEKLIKDLYKEKYAKKAPADRQALAKSLLEEAGRTKDDAAAVWVLYREAHDIAVQVCDVSTVVGAIDGMARYYDIEPMAMKAASLASAGKVAKAPAEFGALAEAQVRLAEEHIANDQYDAADKAATAALQNAKKSGNAALAARCTSRGKLVSEAKSKFQALKGVLETLARTPDDPAANLEMGQFLSFFKGNWDLGLRFLVKGSDATLKALAQKEAEMPTQVADLVAVGDGWWDLAEKEKNGIRKERLQERAAFWYEAASPQASGLVKTKIDKRLQALAPAAPAASPAAAGGGVNLLALIDVNRDAIRGTWKKEADGISSPGGGSQAHLQIPYAPPLEYDLKMVLTLKDGAALDMGIVGGSKWFTVIVNGWGGTTSGIWGINNKRADENESTSKGKVFDIGKATTLLFSVRRDGLTLTADGKPVLNWKGNFNSIVPQADYSPRDPKALFLGTYGSVFTFSSIQLTPVSGQGKVLK